MHLLLVSGFLGSGKTTLVIKLVHAAHRAGKRVAIVVNEIGEIGIDDQLMRQLDMDVWELMGGCICCTLAGDLITTLQKLENNYDPDLVILEPSGAAGPDNILRALPYYKGRPLQSVRTTTLLDPLRIQELYEFLTPLITSQIKTAEILIVSKADVATEQELENSRRIAAEVNPSARLVTCTRDIEPELLGELLP